MLTLFRNQPRPLSMIFMLEIWERFGFYMVQGILVLYFIRMRGFSQQDAYAVFGTFCALIYGMVPIGGYLGDKILGTKRTIVVGLVVLATGYGFLALQIEGTLYWALAWICVGAALFKSNPGSLLAQCYEKDSPQIDSGFTLYYMAVNLGSIGSLLIGPYISGRYGYEYAYMTACLGILLGLLNYILQYPVIAKIKTPADTRHVSPIKGGVLLLSIFGLLGLCVFFLEHPVIARYIISLMMALFIVFYFICMAKATRKERRRLLLVFILMAEAIVFFTLYQQIPTSINLFAVNHVYPEFLGFAIDPQSFQVFNPFWIMILSPGLAYLYSYLTHREIAVGVPYKFAFGMVFCSIAFGVLYLTKFFADEQAMISPWWLIGSYFFQALGELLVSALGVAMVAEFVSSKIMGFVIGVWYLMTAIGGFTGAAVASLTALPKDLKPGVFSLQVYSHAFLEIGIVTFVVACLMGVAAPILMRLINQK